MLFGGERGGFGGGGLPATGVLRRVVGVRPLPYGGTAGPSGLGPDRAAQPVGGAVGDTWARETLQQTEPDSLLEVAGLDAGGGGLGVGLGGQERGEGADEVMGGGHVLRGHTRSTHGARRPVSGRAPNPPMGVRAAGG
ncbi:hypothetical protein I3F58_26570 [Streptomyces sp. MUM 203J]|nr:hypothetical protein [Streptomyces sp. MUM 203J]